MTVTTLHRCPVRSCGQLIRHTLLMCPHHWFRVPRDLRLEVHATWAGYGKGTHTIDDVYDVQSRAIASVNPASEPTQSAAETVKGGAL
jgi:hypothetical protein